MDAGTVRKFEESLARCLVDPDFLDIFYGNFLGSSPKVREKFAGTDFDRQKELLRASFDTMLKAARDEEQRPGEVARASRRTARRPAAPDRGRALRPLARQPPEDRQGVRRGLVGGGRAGVGEAVMGVGISYLCSRYNS